MEKLIHDQIEESNGSSEIRNALLESALLGTGIVKGPFNFNKTLNKKILKFWNITKNELFSKTRNIWSKSFRPSNTNKDLVGSGFDTSN